MLRNQTALGVVRRQGHDDAYHGRTKQPPFTTDILLAAYLAGFSIGHEQRQLEITDGTHPSLFQEGKPGKHVKRN